MGSREMCPQGGQGGGILTAGMTTTAGKTIAIIGAGRLGGAVGFLLAQAGYRITAVVARSHETAAAAARFIGCGEPMTETERAAVGAAILFIATPDRTIRGVCEIVARSGALEPGTIVVHASGAQTLDLLDAAVEAGAFRAVMHPLQSVPSMEQGVKNIPGSYFRVEADPPALAAVQDLVRALGGRELALTRWTGDAEAAALYHAGAVAVSNYFVTLVAHGLKYYQVLGAEKEEALKAVLPLIKGTLANIERLGVPSALTGPIARGDAPTVRGQIAALRRRAPELLDLYRELARETIAVAREQGGISPEAAETLRRLVRE